MNNLPEIRDIQLPDGVSVFPLAYGWWIIMAALILALLSLKVFFWVLKTSRKHYALKQLKNINSGNQIDEAIRISELLRRICAVKYKQASALYGQEWIDFLNQHSTQKLSDEEAELLLFAPFMKQGDTKDILQNTTALKDFCKKWIGANL